MPFPNPVRAVLLDMDGTILDTETIYVGAMFAALAEMGFDLPQRLVHAMIGRPGKECIDLVRAEYGPRFSYEAFQPRYVAHRTERMRGGIPLKPGTAELLDYLDRAGLPVAVATSSTRRNAEENLAATGLLPRFAAVLTRDDVTDPKPHPALFLKAAEAAGVAPGACLAVEDSHVGVRAAHAAGAMTVMVPDMLAPTDEIRALCVHVVADLHAVRGLLHQAASSGGRAP
jgi:HAD superfamily hydrolase (TIGR01509 family)